LKKKRRHFVIIKIFSLIFLTLMLAALGGAGHAQEGDTPTTAEEPADPAAVMGPQDDQGKLVSKKISPGNITIDFKDADIKTVLRVLAEKSGVNIVAGQDVEGYITIRLSNVNWETALEIICKNYGYAYEKDENIIRITTLENLQQEELTTEVFPLNYAKATEVAESIKEMLTERGKDKIKFDERTNVLIVTDIPTNLYKVRQVIAKLDARTPQVLIEAKIIETTLADDERLGIDWSMKMAAAGASRPMTFPFNTIGPKVFGADSQNLLKPFFPMGKGAPAGGAENQGTVPSDDFPASTLTSLTSMPLAEVSDFTMGTLDFSQFSLIMEYLKSRRDTEIVSSPRITTLNNKPATILVGIIIAIPTFERNPDTGTMEITGYTEKELGIKLFVTPHVNDVGDIVVDVIPEVSDLLGYDTLDATRGITAPRYSVRQAATQVMVRDGDTLMIGGLIKNNVVQYEKKVPFLGDLPGVGKWFFTKTEENKDKTELIIFMTVKILDDSVAGTNMASSAFVPMTN